jgi:nondiscriminating glutamyl-tRNA synthetase
MSKVRVRFAPSPTGYLHVGNARTALFNWLFARKENGVFILRVEDTDVERSSREYEEVLKKDLKWLGLDWDEGPDTGGDFGPYRQSERMELYRAHTRKLLENGRAYYCFCSPEELQREKDIARKAGRTPVYSGKCRGIPADEARHRVNEGEPAVVRLKTLRQKPFYFQDLVRGRLSFDVDLIGDFVLVRSNGHPAYNFAVVVDDTQMQITHVIRGEDHLINTVRQLLLFEALGIPSPQYAHLSMVMGEDNTRLSKRHGATSVAQFRKQGVLATALFNYLSLLGWSFPGEKERFTRDELIQAFSLDRVSRSAAIFDYQKLFWINRQYIKSLAPKEKARHAAPFLQEAGILPAKLGQDHWTWLEEAVEILSERVNTLSELRDKFRLLFDYSPEDISFEDKSELHTECGRKVLAAFKQHLPDAPVDFEKFMEIAKTVQQETGCKGKNLYHPLRIALTGKTSGLDLDKFIILAEKGARLNFPNPLKSCAQRLKELESSSLSS